MFMFGYYNEFTFVRRQTFCQLFAKEILKKMLGINPMGLSAPWDDFLEIIVLESV